MDIKAALKKAYKAYKKFITSQQQLDSMFIEAVRAGQADKVKKYMAEGANPSVSLGWQNETALGLSLEKGHREIFDMVLAAGADPNAKSGYYSTPFLVAAGKGDVAAVEAMLEKGAKIDTRGDNGNTALVLAVAAANKPLVDLLLEKGAKPDVPNKYNWTALTYAVRNGDLETMQKLFAKGARTDRLDDQGRDLLAIAQDYDRPQAKRAVLDHRDSLVPRWQRTENDDEVAHISIMRDLGYKLTEVFNTRTRRQTIITHNFETGRDQTVVRMLGEADKDVLAEAEKQLAALKAPPAPKETKQARAQPG